jgi:uncharacterized protein (DUF1330 family)
MAAYCLFDMYEVTDPEKLEQYRRGVLATVKKYGGHYVLIGGKCDIVEGNWRPTFPIMIEFPNLQAAHDWYNSPEYAPLKALRQAGTKNNAVIMESESSPLPEREKE